jgi:hypothetical protein
MTPVEASSSECPCRLVEGPRRLIGGSSGPFPYARCQFPQRACEHGDPSRAKNLISTRDGSEALARPLEEPYDEPRSMRSTGSSARLQGVAPGCADGTGAGQFETTIVLAVGLLMGRNEWSKEDALHILKNASNSRKIKLRDLAAHPSLQDSEANKSRAYAGRGW